MNFNKCIITVSFMLTASTASLAQQKFDVYYVCVGSGNYESDFSKFEDGFSGLENIKAAINSANNVSKVLNQSNSVYGKTILSSASEFVTRNKVMEAVNDVVRRIKNDKKKNPFLIFYYCGHGISEGIAWSLYLIPGNFTLNPSANQADKMDENTVSIPLIFDDVSKELPKLPFMIIADCCYEARDIKPELDKLKEYNSGLKEVMNLSKDVANILRFGNEFHDKNSVLFSTKPGTTVKTVANPLNKSGEMIGPLARRLLMAYQKDSLSWKSMVNLMIDVATDAQTQPAITFWQGSVEENFLIK